jgi:nitrite reductase/ring-hydroxylating ferredoxin subunit
VYSPFSEVLSELPPAALDSNAHFQAEIARFFRVRRCFALHTDRLPRVGSRICLRVAGQEIIAVRSEPEAVRLFANRCLHNGDAILPQGSHGNSHLIRCPHHGWTYGLDGSLLAGPGFSTSGRSVIPHLPELSSSTIGSLIIVGPDAQRVINVSFPNLSTSSRPGIETVVVRSNWKFAVDALCRAGWTYSLPNLAVLVEEEGLRLVRLEPLAPDATALEFLGPEPAGVQGIAQKPEFAELTGALAETEARQPAVGSSSGEVVLGAFEPVEEAIGRAEASGGFYRPLSEGL